MQFMEEAKQTADAWLLLNDAEQFDQGWETAADFFQSRIEKSNWVVAITSARAPLGKARSRFLQSARFTRSLPDAPEGEYVVIQYESQFEYAGAAIETITVMHEAGGPWKVSGYFIR